MLMIWCPHSSRNMLVWEKPNTSVALMKTSYPVIPATRGTSVQYVLPSPKSNRKAQVSALSLADTVPLRDAASSKAHRMIAPAFIPTSTTA
ncbi:MAG: hypothetical protein A4E29_01220 [Methanomassiliicoccales archaeon PtaB.Bin134]|nr:MAG: hypothetical protein A4E29_01220 [Methanomassiliicoccales archaeon PtaB.Bin134]